MGRKTIGGARCAFCGEQIEQARTITTNSVRGILGSGVRKCKHCGRRSSIWLRIERHYDSDPKRVVNMTHAEAILVATANKAPAYVLKALRLVDAGRWQQQIVLHAKAGLWISQYLKLPQPTLDAMALKEPKVAIQFVFWHLSDDVLRAVALKCPKDTLRRHPFCLDGELLAECAVLQPLVALEHCNMDDLHEAGVFEQIAVLYPGTALRGHAKDMHEKTPELFASCIKRRPDIGCWLPSAMLPDGFKQRYVGYWFSSSNGVPHLITHNGLCESLALCGTPVTHYTASLSAASCCEKCREICEKGDQHAD